MIRIATGDIHLSAYSNDQQKNNLSFRLNDIFNSLNQISDYARSNNIKHIDILGDINNDKDVFYTKTILLFREWLQKNRDLTITLLSGNHDMDSVSDDQLSSIEVFADAPNVRIITCPEHDEEEDISWIPFMKNIAHIMRDCKRSKILLSHFGVNEAQLQSGISIIADVGMKELNKYKLVLLGHYHSPQQVKHVYYTGNIIHSTWNDKNEEKRFLVYDTDTLDIKSILLTGYTKYIELVINNESEVNGIFEQEKILKEEGHFVRIQNKTGKEIIQEGTHIISKIEKDITNRGVEMSMTDDEKLQKYCTIKDINNDKYLEIGRELCNLSDIEHQSNSNKHLSIPTSEVNKVHQHVDIDLGF